MLLSSGVALRSALTKLTTKGLNGEYEIEHMILIEKNRKESAAKVAQRQLPLTLSANVADIILAALSKKINFLS